MNQIYYSLQILWKWCSNDRLARPCHEKRAITHAPLHAPKSYAWNTYCDGNKFAHACNKSRSTCVIFRKIIYTICLWFQIRLVIIRTWNLKKSCENISRKKIVQLSVIFPTFSNLSKNVYVRLTSDRSLKIQVIWWNSVRYTT